MDDYTIIVGIIQFASAVLLFILINWIGERSISVGYMKMSPSIADDTFPAFNFLFKVISPPVFIVLYAVVCQSLKIDSLNSSCFLIAVYYWVVRAIVIIVIGHGRLTNWMTYCLYAIISIGISYWIYSILSDVERILPDPKDLLNQLWLLIIVFLYDLINKLQINRPGTIRRKNGYIDRQYLKFNKKYGKLVREECNNSYIEAVTFSIMIYENFNRSLFHRWAEYLCFYVTKKSHTMGIMQVKSSKKISDNESIHMAVDIIKKVVIDTTEVFGTDEPYYMTAAIAEKYNGGSPGYADEITSIFDYLRKQYFKKADEDFRVVGQQNRTRL